MFSLDKIFPCDSTQEEVYNYIGKPIVKQVLNGFNGTCFAYGQTSSGKTHTMQGKMDDPELVGIIPRMVTTIFDEIENAPEHIEFTVKVGIMEIYMERIQDLLNMEKQNL